MSSTEQGPRFIRPPIGSAAQQDVIYMVEFLKRATLAVTQADDGSEECDLDKIAKMIAAASMFAGALLGNLIVAGVVPDQHRKRMTEASARNFRSGIDVGKRQAARVGAAMAGGVQ